MSLLMTTVGVFGAAGSASAAPAAEPTFTPAPAGSKVTHLPRGARTGLVSVVVELAGEPVAVTEAETAQPLTTGQERQRAAQLKQEQTPVAQRVQELGGTVLGTYQHTYNGIKVRIAADKVAAIESMSSVVDVHPVQVMERDNVNGVPLLGAPVAWNAPGNYRGEGIKIAIIDSGIDYTHADFGGPGTAAAYAEAQAAETAPANPAWFGPGAVKVKGGIDLVGDSYNPNPDSPGYQPVPHPDPNPLDCMGHGTHVAGTAAGFGVLADGRTYTGPYNSATVSSQSWLVGPGVAPKADLYAVRVFGCQGSTDVTLDAIEWAVVNDMDVINMSLGSNFGTADSPTAVAADNAAKKGVIVVTSAGNSGGAPYMASDPSTSTNTISVAASDPMPHLPGAHARLSTGTGLDMINANGATFADGTSLPVMVLSNGAGGMSVGCDPAEYTAAGVTGKLVVVQRGACARAARAVFGQKAGAAAVLMVNSTTVFPPFEDAITSNPDTGEQFDVTIPFFGVPSTAAQALLAADGATVTLTNAELANPGYLTPASISSGGPRSGDSALKPDVTGPGVSITSAGVGTGTGTLTQTGTSMAAPHTAGVAALVKQAHPDWRRVRYWKAAIVNTADPGKVNGYRTRAAGAGLVQAPEAVNTQVVALGDRGTSTLNYGFVEMRSDFNQRKVIRLKNFGKAAATFTVAASNAAGSPHTIKLQQTRVTVPARGEAEVRVTLQVPAATAGDSSAFRDVAGLVSLTPVARSNRGVALRVPYYLVPQAVSNIETKIDMATLRRTGATTATVTNRMGVVAGTAQWFAWGLTDSRDVGLGPADLHAVGVQSFPDQGTLAFAISTHHRWSNASASEFNVNVDVDVDGRDDYLVVGADLGGLTTGIVSGQLATAVIDLRTRQSSIEFLADAPLDSSTLVLPVGISQLCAQGSPCLSATNPRLRYHAAAFNRDAMTDTIDGTATFNAFAPAVSTGMSTVVGPHGTATEALAVNASEFAHTPSRGWMIVSHDNRSGAEATLVPVRQTWPLP